jgi:hypothetical protein
VKLSLVSGNYPSYPLFQGLRCPALGGKLEAVRQRADRRRCSEFEIANRAETGDARRLWLTFQATGQTARKRQYGTHARCNKEGFAPSLKRKRLGPRAAQLQCKFAAHAALHLYVS